MNDKYELYVARFEEWMRTKGWSKRTIEDYQANVRYFFDYLDSETSVESLQDINSKIMHSYQNYLYHAKSKRGRRLTLETQHKKLVSIRSFFRFLQEIDVMLFNPAGSIKLPKKRKKLPKGVMTEQQTILLLEQADMTTALGFRDRTIMETLYACAIRNSELRNLTIYDVDTQQMRLTVREGKNAQDRVVPLGEIACDHLKEYLQTVRPQLCSDPKQNLLFVSKNGKQITQANLVWIVQKYVKKLRLNNGQINLPPGICPHSFRHSCATHMLKHGADIRYIQQMLGHASVATTQIYTKVEDADLKAVHRRCHPRERGKSDESGNT